MKRLPLIIAALLHYLPVSSPSIDGSLCLENTPEFQLERFFEVEVKPFGIL